MKYLSIIGIAFMATACATASGQKSLETRVGTVEQTLATKANQASVNALSTLVATNATTTTEALKSVADRLKGHDDKFVAAEAAVKTQGDKLAAVDKTVTEQGKAISAQQQLGRQLMALLRAHELGNMEEKHRIQAALGDKAAVLVIKCTGFTSGKADFDEVLKKDSACKKDLDDLVVKVAAGKAEILSAVGMEDTVKCTEPATDECKGVAKARAEAPLTYMKADVKLASTEKPTGLYGGKPDQNRRTHVFYRNK